MLGPRRWALQGLQFIDNADWDPSDPNMVYTAHERFVLDYEKAPGQGWDYAGYTVDRFKYPHDPRLQFRDVDTYLHGAHRLEGQLFLALTSMNLYRAPHLTFYRFNRETDGEIAIPSLMFGFKRIEAQDKSWPPHQPTEGEWIWRDKNGDGAFDADEYESRPERGTPWGLWIDSRGDLWQAFESRSKKPGIRRLPFGGLDERGNPIYSFAGAQEMPFPAPFTDVKRVIYLPETDTMFVAGLTADRSTKEHDWKAAGRVLARYDNWSRGNRTPKWTMDNLPYKSREEGDASKYGQGVDSTSSIAVAGDYVFAVTARSAAVFVYRADNGTLVGTMEPGPEVGGTSGWIDIPYGINARRRDNGEYLIFAEEGARAKILMYRWTPQK